MSDPNDIDVRLSRLTRASEGLLPSAGFSARVALAIEQGGLPGFWETTWFSGRRLLPVAALCAALAVVWAAQVDNSVDDALATSYASMELE